MSSHDAEIDARRSELLDALSRAGREHSTATVLFHSAIGEQMGLGVTDMKTLDYLARLGPLTAGELGERTGLATASVTGLIDRLEAKGFVRRVRDTKDRRRVIVEPNLEAEARVLPLFRSFEQSLMALLSTCTDEQIETITDFLTRSAGVLRQEALKLRERARHKGAEDNGPEGA